MSCLLFLVGFCLLFVVGTSYQTFCPASKLVTEKGKASGEGSGSIGPKAPIFVQRNQNLVKTVPFVSAVSKAASPSKASMPDSAVPLFLSSLGRGKRNHIHDL